MTATSLIGKEIYTIFEGINIGTINEVIFNDEKTKVKCLKFFDAEEQEYFINYRDIFSIGDFIMIKNLDKTNLLSDNNETNTIFFKNVISDTGNDMGKIINADIDEKGKVINFVTSKNHLVNPYNLKNLDTYCFYSENKITISNYRPRKTTSISLTNNNLNNLQVKIMQLTNPINITEQNQVSIPKKVTYNPVNLIGKRLKDDFYGSNNELIAIKNQQITEKIIANAKRHNKLNNLYYLT